MTGPAANITATIWYKATATATTWTKFDPVGGCLDSIQISEGRAASIAGPTLPEVYRLAWSVEDASEFALFDPLHQGLPLLILFERIDFDPMPYYGWISDPPVEDASTKRIEISATGGIGRANGLQFDDYIFTKLQGRGDLLYWPCDDSGGLEIVPKITPATTGWRAGAGRWYDQPGSHTTDALRPGLREAQQLTDPSDLGNYQSGFFGTFTESSGTESHMFGCTFKVNTPISTTTQTIIGFTELVVPLAPVRTVGFDRTGMTVRAVVRSSSGLQVIGQFAASPDRTYTGIISYRYNGAGGFSAIAHVIDDSGLAVINKATLTGTATTTVFAPFTAGPTLAVVQDVFVDEGSSFTSAGSLERMVIELQGYRNVPSADQFVEVATLSGLDFAAQTSRGVQITAPIGELAPVGDWFRKLEATERGAVYWSDGRLRFETLSELVAKPAAMRFSPVDGDARIYSPGLRTWSQIRNKAIVSGPTGVEWVVTDAPSIAAYGEQSIAVNVLTDDIDSLIGIGQGIVDVYAEPRRRYLTLTHSHATSNEGSPLFEALLFERVEVLWPDGTESSPTVIGRNISYSVNPGGGNGLTVTLTLEDLAPVLTGTEPANTVPPNISGIFETGETITATSGTWTGTPPIVYAYRWQYTLDDGATWANITGDNGNDQTFHIPLHPGPDFRGRRIRVRVTATNRVGGSKIAYSPWSAVIDGDGLEPPAITDLAVTGTATGFVNLAWTEPVSPAADTYTIRFSVDGGVTWDATTTGLTGAAATVSGLAQTLHLFEIQGVNTAGDGPWSNRVSATPAAAALPSQVVGLAASTGASSLVALSWTVATGSPTSYEFQYGTTSPAASAAPIDVGNVTSYTKTELADGVEYWFRVRALNSAGAGAWSDIVTATPGSGAPPGVPVLKPDSVTASTVNLSWSVSTPPADTYRVRWFDSTSQVGETGGITGSTYTIAGLDEDVVYLAEVRGESVASGNSGYSNRVTVQCTAAGVAPSQAADPVLVAGDGQIAISWTIPTGGGAVERTIVRIRDSAGEYTLRPQPAPIDNFTLFGLVNGDEYDVDIVATNYYGSANWSGTVSATPTGAASALSLVASGTTPIGAGVTLTLPASINAGDRLVLFATSRHDVAANKTLTVPSGYSAIGSHSAADYIPNVLAVTKTGAVSDRGATVGFGGNCYRIDYAVVRGGGATVAGGGDSSYGGTLTVPSVDPAGTGLHLVSFTSSETDSGIAATPPNYVNGGLAVPGYGGGGLWYRLNAPDPTGALAFAGSSTVDTAKVSALSVHVQGGATTSGTPSAPALSVTGTTASTISLSWSTPYDGGSAITGYTLYRNAAQIATPSAVTTAYTDTATGTNTYTLRASNANGAGALSAGVVASTGGGAVTYTPGNVFSANMSNVPTTAYGAMSSGALAAAFGSINFLNGSAAAHLKKDAGEDYLTHRYVEQTGSASVVSFGRAIGNQSEVWGYWDYRFGDPTSFTFNGDANDGGKMPGFFGGDLNSGSGGGDGQSGFSARNMWRTNGRAVSYIYSADMTGGFGDDFQLQQEWGVNTADYYWPTGRDIRIIHRLKINTNGGTSDGELEVWVDELQGAGPVRRLLLTGKRWRSGTGYSIDQWVYSAFFGGADEGWHPGPDQFSRLGDVNVATFQPWSTSTGYAAPAAPNLSLANAVTIGSPGENVAATVAAAANNATFYFPNGTYTNVFDVRWKPGQRFIGQSEAGVIIDGAAHTSPHAFRASAGAAHNAVFANMTFQNYGVDLNQDKAVIDCKGTALAWLPGGTPDKAQTCRVHHVTIRNCDAPGIAFGDNWIVDECTFDAVQPQAIGGGDSCGGRITRNHFEKCGANGASGNGANSAAIKLAVWNCGPHGSGEGTEEHLTLGPGTKTLLGPEDQCTTTPATLTIDTNTFDCLTPGAGPADNGKSRAIWLDLDCRMFDIAYNTIDDPYAGVFVEGCNNGWVHHNTINRGGYFTPGTNRHNNIYFGAAALTSDSSDNVIWEDNTLADCVASLIVFLGDRGGSGADWTDTAGYSDYALSGLITNSYAAIGPTARSTVGSSNHTVRRNALTGSSVGFGYWLGPSISTGSTNIGTMTFEANTFAITTGQYWYWQGARYDRAGWIGLGNS